jgi:transposase
VRKNFEIFVGIHFLCRDFCDMAFLRIDKKDGEQYMRIVASKRKAGKPTHQTIYNLGKVSDYTPAQLKRFGAKFYELGGGDPRELLEGQIEELGRYNYGYYQLFSKIFAQYRLDVFLKHISLKHKLGLDLVNAVMLMLLERLHAPCSKRQNHFNQDEYLGIEPVALHWLYRSLDYLAQYQQQIQQHIYQPSRDLFNNSLDVVFYDVTTFYFESETEEENALRQKGFSKDGKIGNTQILFGLLIDRHKRPIGYRIYKGNTFEGHTFEKAIQQLKEQYQIKNIILVADRGMLNRNNIQITEAHQFEYIIGEKLKSLPQAIKSRLIEPANYKNTWTYDLHGECIRIQYHTIEHEGRKIICTYSEKRARKDAQDREDRIEKARQLLKYPQQLKRKAQHYFLQAKDATTYSLNEEKIKQSKQYDGYLAIATNSKDLTDETILDNYRHLYQIEHSFRTFKTHLETRPMFHWTDKRIEGHMCLCYIAYALLTNVQNKILKTGSKLSESEIRKAMDAMQVSLIRNKENHFYLRSANKENIDLLINRLGLKKLPNIVQQREINNYL